MNAATPDYNDAWRDLIAALRAAVTGDVQGLDVILDNTADLRTLAAMQNGALEILFMLTVQSAAAQYGGMSREQAAAHVETHLLAALAKGPPWGSQRQEDGP